MGEAGELSKKGYQRKKCKGEAGSVGTLLLGVCACPWQSRSSFSHPPSSPLLLDIKLGCSLSGLASRHSPGSQNVGGGGVGVGAVTKQKLMNQRASGSAFSK